MANPKFPVVILLLFFAFIFGLFTILNVSNVAVGFRIVTKDEVLKTTLERGAAVMSLLLATIFLVMLAYYVRYKQLKR